MSEHIDSTARPETAATDGVPSQIGQIAAAAWDYMRENTASFGRQANEVNNSDGNLVMTNPFATNEPQQVTSDTKNPIKSTVSAPSEQDKLSPVDKALTKMFADQHLDDGEVKRLRNLLTPECLEQKPSKPKPALHGVK
ncbi:MAG: hypothetical protein JST89_13705 [Cyanobacteria bacterium SZAS-4]|nr:hypothetical protein [Cyanobacteria bacterium SZAS-4]